MWEYVEDRDQDLQWIVNGMANNTLVMVADGSFDRKKSPKVSAAGWIICCRRSQKMLRGSFFEVSSAVSASAYRGELLGLVALHTFMFALVSYYQTGTGSGKMCCDNIGALNQANWKRKRVKTGAKQSDLLRALRTIQSHSVLDFQYEHVRGHQDDHKKWEHMTLEEQLNFDCDLLAKAAGRRALVGGAAARPEVQLLPLEKAAVVVDNTKLTTDVADAVRFAMGEEEARQFYTAPIKKKGGGLGWSNDKFHAVDWRALHEVLQSKPDMFGLWLTKQVTGVCATRVNMSRIQNLLDDRCPNCQQRGETARHLNLCPDDTRTKQFKSDVDVLVEWMGKNGNTDTELVYWIPKYILLRGTVKFVDMGPMSTSLREAGQQQDLIGWQAFMEGKVAKAFGTLQSFHCSASPCHMNGKDWMKKFITHLLHISHSQWLVRNFTLHEAHRGYLQLQRRRVVLKDISKLVNIDPMEIPDASRFLLEMDFPNLLDADYVTQSYWVRAMKAATRAGRRTAFVLRR